MKLIREFDDFDWIRDTNPLTYEYLLGKALEFNPAIEDKDTLEKIINPLKALGFYASWADNIDWEEGETILGLYFQPANRIIWTGELYDEDYQAHINDYADETVDVLDGWDVLRSFTGDGLNESEENVGDDFDWVREDYKELVYKGNVFNGMRVKINTNSGDYKSNPSVMFSFLRQSEGGLGTVIDADYDEESKEWVQVEWDNEEINVYPINADEAYSLEVIYDNALNESDQDNDLDWIINIEPNAPIRFNSVVVGRRYRVEPTEVLREAIVACDDDIDIYYEAKSVIVLVLDHHSYDSIFCDSERSDEVLTLKLSFFNHEGVLIGNFWVTEDMVNFYEYYSESDLNESDQDNDLDWIINIKEPIAFSSVKDGERYGFEPTDVIIKAMEACEVKASLFNDLLESDLVEVKDIKKLKYSDVFCGSERSDEVLTLKLKFYNQRGRHLFTFWVTEDMLYLYDEFPNKSLTENEEDEWGWAKEVESNIRLMPYTLYYFEPPLKEDELKFISAIINPRFGHMKEWLNNSARIGIKYFVTDYSADYIKGWCNNTDPMDALVHIYNKYKAVDGREYFGLNTMFKNI